MIGLLISCGVETIPWVKFLTLRVDFQSVCYSAVGGIGEFREVAVHLLGSGAHCGIIYNSHVPKIVERPSTRE